MSEKLLEYDVAVIGAGPAGSNAAYECAKNGYSVIILEEDPVVGVPVPVSYTHLRAHETDS